MGSPPGLPSRDLVTWALAASLAAGAGAACDGPTRPDDGIASIAILVESTVLRPGFFTTAVAEARDVDGVPVPGVHVRWRSLTPDKLGVDDAGLVLAHAPGIGRLRASVGDVSGEIELQLVNPPPATLTLSLDTLHIGLGASWMLSAIARDVDGVSLTRPLLEWESTAPRIADVAIDGRVASSAAGMTRIIVHLGALADTTVVLVEPTTSPNGPLILGTQPAVARPGQVLIVSGERFSTSLVGNTVRIDGTAIPVVGASATELRLGLPASSAFACAPTGPATLQVTTTAGTGTRTIMLQSATEYTLGPSQSLVLPDSPDGRCLELAPAAGEYLITIQNTARVIGTSTTGFTLFGGPGEEPGALVTDAALSRDTTPAITTAADLVHQVTRRSTQRHLRAHAALLRANREAMLASRFAAPGTSSPQASLRTAGLGAASLVVGSRQPVRVPNLGSPTPCQSFTEVGTRTAFVGPHLAILEDTSPVVNGAPSLRGMIDATYEALGAEFEAVIWPTLQVFGDPLVMDSRLDDNGRIIVVFTPRMNEMLGGSLLAATTTCDLRQRQLFPSSNVGEYVYAQVPTSLEPGFTSGKRDRWFWGIRGTLAHELKHVTSYAERTVRDQTLVPEEEWLEEATARHAEELFARATYGTVIRGNHGFDATLRCETNIDDAVLPIGCTGRPRAMLPHFEGLWDFLDESAARSPLGPSAAGDFSFYGAAWALTRWALDHSGLPEETFFRAITLSPVTGVANLEARVGRSWPELLGEWSLALASDDRLAQGPEQPRLTFPSWNLKSIFQGLCDELGSCVDPDATPNHYPRADPLRRSPASGTFAVEFPISRAGGFGVVELDATTATRQLIGLRGYRGRALPDAVRISILRTK